MIWSPAVIRYIQNQEAHHAKRSFEDEYLLLLKKHGISYDSKYVLGDGAAPLGLESFFLRLPHVFRRGLNNPAPLALLSYSA